MQSDPNAPEWVAEAKQLRPLSYEKIGLKFGVTRNEVYYWLKTKNGGEPLVCQTCGEEFTANARQLNRRYCSTKCRPVSRMSKEGRKRMAESRRGSGNPAFKHGKRVGWGDVRTKFNLTLKGERVCRSCGSEDWPALHHAIPRSMCRATRLELLNGLPLCAKCHMGWHHRTVTIYRDCFTEAEWEFLSSVQLTGQQIGPWLDEHYPDRGQPFRSENDGVMHLEQGLALSERNLRCWPRCSAAFINTCRITPASAAGLRWLAS